MGLNIVCAGYMVRHPLGGFVWHHLQYLIGLKRMGHRVTYFEHYGLRDSCYDPALGLWTSDASYGIEYLVNLLRPHGLERSWCYIGEDETARGMDRIELARACRDCDLFLNLSNINWIPEIAECRRRALVDTDPVFTQIGAHGLGGAFSDYDVRFTYGENVHAPQCEMPTADCTWLPTRQPVVLDLWQAGPGDPSLAFTTVMSWTAFGAAAFAGRVYGQKDRQFEPFFDLPMRTGERMELAATVPGDVHQRLERGGWALRDPLEVTLLPSMYQEYLRRSKGEFSVAKHAYVSTRCGWFSDRSASYLASGRPVVVEDTGFSGWIDTGSGLLAFRSREDAISAIADVNSRYPFHCRAARQLAGAYFDSGLVLSSLLERALGTAGRAEGSGAA